MIKDTDNLYKSIAKKLHENFVINKKYFAEQSETGKYSTKNKMFDPLRINNMLVNKKSYLTYQQLKSRLIWLCLDYDIDKKVVEKDFFSNQEYYFDLLIREVRNTCRYLDELGIQYISEFSGNRGIHLWIVFTQPVEKKQGYLLLEKILNKQINNLDENINIDLFPKNKTSKNNKVGFGVKLPLSFHQKSRAYSYLIDDIYSFEYSTDMWRTSIDDKTFLFSQLDILNNYIKQEYKEIAVKLDIEEVDDEEEIGPVNPFLPTKKALLNQPLNLAEVLTGIKKCSIVDEVLKNYPNNMKESERVIIVGLLNKLRTKENKNYGKELLWEFFSLMDNFRPELTKKKLENLNLYPPTCSFLKSKYDYKCDFNCKCDHKIRNIEDDGGKLVNITPLRFLDSIDISSFEDFEVRDFEIERVIKAQKKYTNQNDEISFLSTQIDLERLDRKDMKEAIESVLDRNNYTVKEVYKFSRLEKHNKTRVLHSLQAEDKVITTYLVKLLNSFYYTEFSDNSYGYKFENSFANYNIFKPWMQQWLIYKKMIMERLEDEVLQDHYVVKLDIKNFYSRIDIGRLKTKLIHGPSKTIKEKIALLPDDNLRKYNNMVDYLIECCSKETFEGKGVPQGPAYARYLAEVYLIELDKYIEEQLEEGFNFYFRYVDDIVLIVEDKEKASKLLSRVNDYLESLDLEINWEKYFQSQVIDSKSEFENYFNQNKYFVDSSSKHQAINSVFTNKKATSLLSKMVKPNLGEINDDNLSFYFTHYNSNKRLLEERRKFEPYIFNLKVGRGSLFRNYFNFYFKKNMVFGELVENSKYLDGLGRGVFLNTLLDAYFNSEFNDKPKIKQILQQFTAVDLLKYETELVLSFMLLDNELINEKFILNVEMNILTKVIGFRFEKQIPEVLEEVILEHLEKERDLKEFISLTYNLVFFNNLSQNFIIYISKLFFNKIIQSMGTIEPKDFIPSFLNGRQSINQYYQLCCLLTLIENNFINIKRVWENLIVFTNVNYPQIEIDYNSWLKRTSALNFKVLTKNNLNTILTIKLHDNFVDGKGDIDNLKIYDHFHTGIVLFLMEVKEDTEMISDYLAKESLVIIKDIQKKYHLEFLKWIIDESNVFLFPDKKIGQKNIIENDRIVLQRGNQLLVRFSKNEVKDITFGYLEEVQVKHEKWLEGEYVSIIYKYNKEDYKTIKTIFIEETDFLNYLRKIIDVNAGINKFRKSLVNKDRFPNALGDLDTIHKETYLPLIPFSTYDKKLILSDNEIIDNNATSFYTTFFSKIKNDIELFEGKPYSMKTTDLESKFFPVKIRKNPELMFYYLKIFLENATTQNLKDVFNFESTKFKSVVSLLNTKSKILEEEKRLFYLYFEYYHSFYKEGEDLLKLLFYPIDVEDGSVFEVYQTISNSLCTLITTTDRKFFSDLIQKEISNLSDKLSNELNFEDNSDPLKVLNAFKRCSFDFDEVLDEINIKTHENDWHLTEEEFYDIKLLSPQDKKTLVKVFERSDINTIENTAHLFAYKFEGNYLLVVLPDIMTKTLDTIRTRKKLKERYEKEKDNLKLDCFRSSVKIEDNIVYSPYFPKAVEMIKEQSFYNQREIKKIEMDLVSWLRNFDEAYHIPLLAVISSHQCIKNEDLENYLTTIQEALKDKTKVFFHIKKAEDFNGFHRLITSNFPKTRELKLNQFVSRVLTEQTSDLELVILSEVGISGSQFINALKRYYLADELNTKIAEKEKYYSIPRDSFESFKKKFKSFKKIHLYFVSYTDKSKRKIIEEICSLLDYPIERIVFYPETNSISFEESVLISNPEIDAKHKKQFEELIRDSESIAEIFNLNEVEKLEYTKYLKDLDRVRNKYNSDYSLILRKGSTPKKSHPIFCLSSSKIPSLFERTKEHEE
ncbi:reverse transcriptase domain-containing protein [Rossellomorea vietnamensis]|uniref:reverse transcriptase domain-containing protein n=1 Tax=Rossellomorea vietnamensis TaxID=218284 RepID=UPI002078FA94|nr:reverse transcriptase domain-containing protein [Rossellomorea vietnamensis]